VCDVARESVAHRIEIKSEAGTSAFWLAAALAPGRALALDFAFPLALELEPVCDGRSERRPATIGFDEVEAGCRNGRPSMGRTPC